MPSTCFNLPRGTETGPSGKPLYVRKHNPWMYFRNIADTPRRCENVVPLQQLETDLDQRNLPDLTWIVPNMIHDMHDGSVRDGDAWLASIVPRLLESDAWRDHGVLFILWDEGSGDEGCCGGANGGHTPALIVSPDVKPGYRSDVEYTHYSVLRTIEDSWQLGWLGHAGATETSPMNDLFR